jgi:hypothetical protein
LTSIGKDTRAIVPQDGSGPNVVIMSVDYARSIPLGTPAGVRHGARQSFHFDKSRAWLRTRHMLDGLTAAISASSIMNVNRR